MKTFYLSAMVLGTLIPWLFFGSFFAANGVDIRLFITSVFPNGAAGGFSADVLISIVVFWIWAYQDRKEKEIKNWWLIFPAGFFVGLSLALPLYLYLREREKSI